MHHDNPASRLHAILESVLAVEAQAGTRPCASVWHDLLETGGASTVLISRLGAVMQLPLDASTEVRSHFPSRNVAHWHDQVANAFASMGLGNAFDTFRGQISPQTVELVGFAGELLHTAVPTPLLKEDDLSALIKQLVETLEVAKNATDIPPAFKREMVTSLHALIKACRDYRISGGRAILAQVEAMKLHPYVDSRFGAFLDQKTPIGEQFKKCVETAAAVLTVITTTGAALAVLQGWSHTAIGAGHLPTTAALIAPSSPLVPPTKQ